MKYFLVILGILCASTPFFAFGQAQPIAAPASTNGSTPAPCGALSTAGNCYTPLSPITDPSNGQSIYQNANSFPGYLQAMYRIGIGACFVLGVIMFTYAGIEYILSESVTKKSDAIKRIQASLIGLSIALVSYILLNTINPDLLKLNNLQLGPAPTSAQ